MRTILGRLEHTFSNNVSAHPVCNRETESKIKDSSSRNTVFLWLNYVQPRPLAIFSRIIVNWTANKRNLVGNKEWLQVKDLLISK